ncbi:hypothetical protein [Candidatus Nitrospira nitrificans]|jgi:hypothetical protein|uniref:Uncharacterized protein n=1 Tax=Candidatus Nitrospira nitrificans TaxID=1742973 RepID=A0A0S4LI68_9BACT|nr:hypothetical protein [Candidatus Nitrospira nitrificans]CUS36280.1 hypothetical protein COMA2_210066 [Candidatus Nitrospira nitrificans]
MAQRPFQTGAVVNLVAGESSKETVVVTVPKKKRFHTHYLGINGFGHSNQPLFYAVHVTTRSRVGIYPIAPTGVSEIDEPEFPTRFFGSQEAILYADPGSDLIFTVSRKETTGNVRVFMEICGLLVDV